MASMAGNPNPSRITEAWWWFGQELLKLEPDTELSGFYDAKAGYHNTRLANLATDYSVRAAADKLGPDDKSAAVDWTFRSAQRGDYKPMARYGARLNAAFDARDSRLAGWREALGQTDADKAAEGLDFQGWYRRVPNSSHEWHFHFSELRKHAESYDNKRAMLSVLRGETLAQWQGATMADDYGKYGRPKAVGDRPIAVLVADVWRELRDGTGAYEDKASPRGGVNARLDRVETAQLGSTAREIAAAKSNEMLSTAVAALAAGGGTDAAPILARINEVAGQIGELQAALDAANARAEAAEARENTLLAKAYADAAVPPAG